MKIKSMTDPINQVNQGVVFLINKTTEIVNSPEKIKKTGSFVKSTIKALVYFDKDNRIPSEFQAKIPQLLNHLSWTGDVLDFFESVKNGIYWINPINQKSLKEKGGEFKVTLATVIFTTQIIDPTVGQAHVNAQVEKISANLFGNNRLYLTKGHLRHALEDQLRKLDYADKDIKIIIQATKIEQRERPVTETLIMMGFTGAGLGDNVLSLNKWGLIDLAKTASTIGTKVKTLSFLRTVAIVPVLDTVFGGIAGLSLTLVVCHKAKQLAEVQSKIRSKESELRSSTIEDEGKLENLEAEKLKLVAERTKLIWSLVFASVQLTCLSISVAAFIVGTTLNPSAVIILALVAKGTGFVSLFVK